MKRMWMAVALMILASTLVFAQGGKKKKGEVDLSTLRTVNGTVTTVSMDYGLGQPGFVMDAGSEGTLSVHLGPYWYLVSQNFSVGVGDAVSAVVTDCPKTRDKGDVTAFSVDDLTSATSVVLRDEAGLPVWKKARGGHGNGGGQGDGQGNGQGNGRRQGGYGAGLTVDLTTLVEMEGTVAQAGLGMGTHQNAITFSAGGTDYSLGLGPLWYMVQQGFSVTAGDGLRVRMAQCARGWVAFDVTNLTTGSTLVLRDEQGVPLWLD